MLFGLRAPKTRGKKEEQGEVRQREDAAWQERGREAEFRKKEKEEMVAHFEKTQEKLLSKVGLGKKRGASADDEEDREKEKNNTGSDDDEPRKTKKKRKNDSDDDDEGDWKTILAGAGKQAPKAPVDARAWKG